MEVPLGRRHDLVVDDAPVRASRARCSSRPRAVCTAASPSPGRARTPRPSADAGVPVSGAARPLQQRREFDQARRHPRDRDGVPVALRPTLPPWARAQTRASAPVSTVIPSHVGARANAGSLAQRRHHRLQQLGRARRRHQHRGAAAELRRRRHELALQRRRQRRAAGGPVVEGGGVGAGEPGVDRLAVDVLGGQRIERRDDVGGRWRRRRSSCVPAACSAGGDPLAHGGDRGQHRRAPHRPRPVDQQPPQVLLDRLQDDGRAPAAASPRRRCQRRRPRRGPSAPPPPARGRRCCRGGAASPPPPRARLAGEQAGPRSAGASTRRRRPRSGGHPTPAGR